MLLAMKPISADSHVTEPPNCYVDYIEPRYRDRAPTVRVDEKRGPLYVIEGIPTGVSLGTLAAAGKNPKDIKLDGATWDDVPRGGWDPKVRLYDQDRDGVSAEMIYPSVGMVLCGSEDADYKNACFQAYNRWLSEFVSAAPKRLFGAGQTAVRSVEETIEDFRKCREVGFKTMLMPLHPATAFDYDDPRFDTLWQAAVDLDMPISFHILAGGGNKKDAQGNYVATRGPSLGAWISTIRGVQDLVGAFVFTGMFDRNPNLKIVCVEGDAGWVPHMMYRMDHAYQRHRYWNKGQELQKRPSEYFLRNLRFTFQDDFSALQAVTDGRLDPRMIMWANDFPHSDATWPNSMTILGEQMQGMNELHMKQIVHDNVAELYSLADVP